jgi:hypothetical protein
MGHWHTGLIRLAIPAHILAALLFFRSQLRIWYDARHDRPSEEKDPKDRSENGSALHTRN